MPISGPPPDNEARLETVIACIKGAIYPGIKLSTAAQSVLGRTTPEQLPGRGIVLVAGVPHYLYEVGGVGYLSLDATIEDSSPVSPKL